ncbi:MAG: hypothetical protein HZB57_06660 [Gammaproteobacteria bacterium]|nr:hypothetical protein [Gammaproteobacteria bacterium]
MPQRFGNALACELLRRLWRLDLADLGPHRALARDAFFALELEDRSFGWMVEMSVRAHKLGLVCAATPVCWRARAGGISKIGGNIIGVVKAGVGILGMIARLAWRERRRPTRVFHRRAVRAAHPIPQPEGEHS